MSRAVTLVGAGPAGLATATQLARSGWAVRVLERRAGIEQKICGECLSPPSRALLRELGALTRIPPSSIRELDSIAIHGPLGSRCVLSFGTDRAFAVPRPVLDTALLESAREAGARVEFSKTVVELARAGSGFELTLKDGARVASDVVIGADGRHSWVARKLGLAAKKEHPLKRAAVMGHFLREGRQSGVELHVTRWGYVGVNPLPPTGDGRELLNVIAVLAPDELKRRLAGAGPGGMQQLLEELVRGASATPALRALLGPAESVSSRTWSATSLAWVPARITGADCALVGDSAGFVDPFTGEGLYHSLAASNALVAALQAGELSDYARWHAEIFGPEQVFCHLLQRLLPHPRMADYVIRQLAAQPKLAATMAEAVADRLPVREVLKPGYWLRLLSPLRLST